MTLLIFHFEISGSVNNEIHSQKMHSISSTLFVDHLERSGNDSIFWQLSNKFLIFFKLLVFHFDISGIFNKLEHL